VVALLALSFFLEGNTVPASGWCRRRGRCCGAGWQASRPTTVVEVEQPLSG
jgi:hypothetical protein